ncbi:MAG: amino acid adenylation domain-containing protein, partial [Algicola sp.]|nr:amino acid adenylation domain-containing protein [Algicola sp.]
MDDNAVNSTTCEPAICVEQHAADHPNNIALIFGDMRLNYHELNMRVNQLARYLIECHQIGPDILVGLCLERSIEMVVAMLAIMRAGGAYVPLDPNYPKDRLNTIAEQTGFKLLMSQRCLLDSVPTTDASIVWVDDEAFCRQLSGFSGGNGVTEKLSPKRLVYVIHTSGSTGQPKGVMIEAAQLGNLLGSMSVQPGFGRDDTLLAITSMSFDIHALEIFLPLVCGGKLIVAGAADVAAPEKLIALITRHKVSVMQATPASWKMLLEFQWQPQTPITALCGGEALSETLKNRLLSHPAVTLWNLYGPTETCVWSAVGKMSADLPVTLGQPIDNTYFYVLDNELNPCAAGVSGQLCIGGTGVARGYLNRPDLTCERFVTRRFSAAIQSDRLYKTGDLVKRTADGQWYFMGRMDSQVKVNGFRIELKEIEYSLCLLDAVKDAKVLCKTSPDDNHALVAYVVTDSLSKTQLLAHLSSKLPGYMVPNAIVIIKALPLTPNGKVDSKALPAADFLDKSRQYVAPNTPLQTALCLLWEKVMGLDRVGINDNFFQLGGNSITALKLAVACSREMGMSLPLSLLIEQKNIEAIVPLLTQHKPQVYTKAQTLHYPLSFAQQALLFIERFEQGTEAYHIPHFVSLDNECDLAQLQTAAAQVINRHPILKTVYRTDADGADYQCVQDMDVRIVIEQTSATELIPAVKAAIAKPFDLTCQPSIKMVCYRLEDRQYLLILWHHIAFDGWSIDIFMAQLSEYYQALQQNIELSLPELTINYGDYAHWQRQSLQGEKLLNLQQYWSTQLGDHQTLMLP